MKVDAQGHEEKDIRRLREFATFDKLSDNDLQCVVLAAHHTSTSAPLPLIHEQTPSDACYILLSERDDLARLLDEIPALRETMDATIARHAPVAVPEQPAKPKPTHCRVDALVATELVERFERAADGAGVRVSAALEDALTQWIQRNGT